MYRYNICHIRLLSNAFSLSGYKNLPDSNVLPSFLENHFDLVSELVSQTRYHLDFYLNQLFYGKHVTCYMWQAVKKLTMSLWFLAEKPGSSHWQKTDKQNKIFHSKELLLL